MSAPESRASTLQIELVTPEGPAYSDEARMIIVPGQEGELGVLPRHAPLVARLEPGETRIQKSAESWVSYATGSGYFKIQSDTASVIVGSAVLAADIDVAQAERDRDEAQAAIEAHEGDEETGELRRARRALEDAENRLRVAQTSSS